MNVQRPVRLLIVEDDSDDYRLIAQQLKAQYREIIIDRAKTFSSAEEKLGRISFDVILTDLSLPDSIGVETVSKLRAIRQDMPIIVLSGLGDESLEQDLLQAGAQDYLVKDELNGRATLRALLHAVQRQQMRNELQQVLAERDQHRILLEKQTLLLEKKNRRLRQLYKTAQEFVDNVSHDFRTPLTVIKDFVAIIREGIVGDINPEQAVMLDKVLVRADDLNHMVDDLLDSSKLEAGLLGACRCNVSVSELFDRTESLLRHRAQVRDIDLRVEADPNLPEIYCDPDMIGRVITNLTVNAIKFSGEGGKVRLWTQVDPASQELTIGVTDDGPGIDKESLSKVFARFRQASSQSNAKGFGLGLNIAQKFCQINMGKLSVESSPGEGSTFSFTIPIADPPKVLSRWLDTQYSKDSALQLIEISVPTSTNAPLTDEFDSFLNCLLKKHHLLFRVLPEKWLLVMPVPSSQSDNWNRRVQEEFDKRNRNRPLGLLPDYVVKVSEKWSTTNDPEAIVAGFEAVYQPHSELVGELV